MNLSLFRQTSDKLKLAADYISTELRDRPSIQGLPTSNVSPLKAMVQCALSAYVKFLWVFMREHNAYRQNIEKKYNCMCSRLCVSCHTVYELKISICCHQTQILQNLLQCGTGSTTERAAGLAIFWQIEDFQEGFPRFKSSNPRRPSAFPILLQEGKEQRMVALFWLCRYHDNKTFFKDTVNVRD